METTETLKLSFQQLLEIENPDSDVVKSQKVLFCYLLPLDEYISDFGENYVAVKAQKDPEWFFEYITCWSTKEGSNKKISTLKSKKYDYIIFFAKEKRATSFARFVGCYKNNGVAEEECIVREKKCVRFSFEKNHDFDSLEGRVVIKWPETDRSILEYWHKGGDVENGEIQPKYVYQINDLIIPTIDFTHYEDVVLSFSQLKEIIENGEDGQPEWKGKLSVVNGVYCIVDKTDGSMYIGAAYGEEGIWGRWREYVMSNGHGNNVKMKTLLVKDNVDDNVPLKIDEFRRDNLQWSILEIIPQSKPDDVVLAREKFYKEKFCTRIQLNGN